jgi:hypothetical protein
MLRPPTRFRIGQLSKTLSAFAGLCGQPKRATSANHHLITRNAVSASHPRRHHGCVARAAEAPHAEFVFTSDRRAALSAAEFAKMVERAGEVAKPGFQAHPHTLRLAPDTGPPTTAGIRCPFNPTWVTAASAHGFVLRIEPGALILWGLRQGTRGSRPRTG